MCFEDGDFENGEGNQCFELVADELRGVER
jgi:hypothetical protein